MNGLQRPGLEVFLLWHTNPETEDDKLIGVYSSMERAAEARSRALIKPGFRSQPDGFCIGRREIDRDDWTEGFTTEYLE